MYVVVSLKIVVINFFNVFFIIRILFDWVEKVLEFLLIIFVVVLIDWLLKLNVLLEKFVWSLIICKMKLIFVINLVDCNDGVNLLIKSLLDLSCWKIDVLLLNCFIGFLLLLYLILKKWLDVKIFFLVFFIFYINLLYFLLIFVNCCLVLLIIFKFSGLFKLILFLFVSFIYIKRGWLKLFKIVFFCRFLYFFKELRGIFILICFCFLDWYNLFLMWYFLLIYLWNFSKV